VITVPSNEDQGHVATARFFHSIVGARVLVMEMGDIDVRTRRAFSGKERVLNEQTKQ
jgi:hypothetical protein